MNITLSYSGGTSRGWQLGKAFDRLGILKQYFTPSCGRKIDYFPAALVPLLFGDQGIDPRKIETSIYVTLFRKLMHRTRNIRRVPPTERFRVNEKIDRSVARRLRSGADLLLSEAQISLHTIRRAKELGMATILDRTNSHIAYQSEIWAEEHRRFNVDWAPNSERVIEKGIKEYEEADYIFALSSYVRQTFIDRGIPAAKVLCVPSGIDLSSFRQIEKTDTVFRIVYCGILQLKKGTHYLLQAFDELKLKNAELWLIGSVSKEMVPLLRRFEGSFHHFGYVPNSQLSQLYSQGSVFVLPSLEEGLAKVLIEAMACGLPVVATTNTGAGDVVHEGTDGFVIPIRDVEALKSRILFLYQNQELCRQMGQSAKERVHAEFTLDRYVARILTAFQEVMRVHQA